MTIGDEKVVQRWSLQYVSALEGDFLCADPAGHYVTHSAYAELAAELALAISARNAADERHDELKEELEAAESQLAELRGGVLEIDALMRKDITEFGGCLKLVNRLRTLAAADGG